MAQDRYNIAGSSYIKAMDEKTSFYKVQILRAERLNADKGGKVSKEEADYYYRAIKACEEIMNMNLSQREVYNQWKNRKEDCEQQYKLIVNTICPHTEKTEKITQKTVDTKKVVATQTDSNSVPKTSESGFTSQYASKVVPIEMIESWFRDEDCKVGFDQIIGRTELKNRLLREVASLGFTALDKTLGIPSAKSYFLYGPPGTGKSFLIEALAYELKQKGFHFMHLLGSQIHDMHVGVAEKIVTAAFNVAMEHEPCLLFMDEIDNLCRPRNNAEGHEQRLTVAFMEAYNRLKSSDKRVVFMGATNHPTNVDEAMLDRIALIKIPLPAEEDRIGYFDRLCSAHKEKAALVFEEGLTAQHMASVTDNFSYRDLDRITGYMAIQLKVQALTDYEVLDENGNLDLNATDERASQAVRNGELKITRALFEKALKENPPSDKTAIRKELQEFEGRNAAMAAE